MRPLKIFTTVWGDTHLDWFERALVKSLCWPKNKTVLRDASWSVISKLEDKGRALAIADKVETREIKFAEIPAHVQGSSPEMGHILLQAFFMVMKECLETGSQLLIAPPDTIFADNSIPNLIAMAQYGHTCVSVPHPRVSPSIFGSIPKDGTPLSSAQLVSLAHKHAHRAWSEAEINHPKQNSFIGGIAWQKLSSNPHVVSVQHRLPTVYLANFLPSDYTFFQRPHDGLPPTFGVIDHLWPKDLYKQERIRAVGSSDACFIAEVTREDANVPPFVQMNAHEPDAYWRSNYHNQINRQFCTIFRGE